MRISFLASLIVGLMLAPHAAAQWSPSATLDLGMGFGQMALSQAALESARRLGKESGAAFYSEPEQRKAPAFAPVFIPDPEIARTVEQRFILLYGGDDPANQAIMAEEVASRHYHDRYLELMREYGLEPRLDNLLEVTAARYVKLWEIVHGRNATAAQARAVRDQLAAQLGNDFWMRRMDDAEKQELAETFVLHVAAADIAHTALLQRGDAELLERYRAGVQANLLPDGPRVDRLELTDTGFVRP